uniref:hypothetical protein n=1 Tax=Acetatifactor sp. TaxID=1872090 RepID=UPI0040579631
MVCFYGKKKRLSTIKKERSWAAVQDTRIIKRKSDSLQELRKQSRNLVPRFPVYPFTLLKQGNVVIPYTATVTQIASYLRKDMTHFKCGVIALVWKGDKESYKVLCWEFKNKDYYRRKLVIEYLVYHDMFEMNGKVLWR